MPDEDSTLACLAFEAYKCFETATRPNGESFHRVREGSPEWLSDLTWKAHDDGKLLPDDWRYATIVSALELLAEADDPDDDAAHEFADENVDIYNHDRLAWLAAHSARPGYVDQAREEGLIGADADTLDAIGVGQYVESLEVFEQVRSFLQDRLDSLDDEEGV